jgi:predicted DNA-binding transcriptional regulator YafY
MLDDEEAVAVAIGLRTAASGTISGIEESSVRALAKLQQVLPSRLRRRVDALQSYTLAMPSHDAQVDPDLLTVIVAACRDHEQLRFDHRSSSGVVTRRSVEPYRLVYGRRRWYLVSWDVDRDDWRTFRVDRIEHLTGVGLRFAEREPPGGDAAAHVRRGSRAARWTFQARLLVHATAAEITERLGPAAESVEVLDTQRCLLTLGASSPAVMASWLGFIGADFEVLDSPELAAEVRALAERYQRALTSSPG